MAKTAEQLMAEARRVSRRAIKDGVSQAGVMAWARHATRHLSSCDASRVAGVVTSVFGGCVDRTTSLRDNRLVMPGLTEAAWQEEVEFFASC